MAGTYLILTILITLFDFTLCRGEGCGLFGYSTMPWIIILGRYINSGSGLIMMMFCVFLNIIMFYFIGAWISKFRQKFKKPSLNHEVRGY